MRKLCFILLHVFIATTASSQTSIIDSFKRELTKTTEQKIDALGYLCRTLMNSNLPESDKYGQQMIEMLK